MKASRPPLGLYLLVLVGIVALTYSCVYVSQANAQPRTVEVPCGADLDQKVNSDSKTTPTRFVLDSCTYQVSQTMRPQNGDEIVGVEGVVRQRPVHGTYPDNLTTKLEASGSLDVVMKPRGEFYLEWVDCSGASFDGTSGSGVCIAGGEVADSSVIRASRFHHNEGVGVSNAHGTFIDVEADNNGSSASRGFIAGGIKGVVFYKVEGGYFHHNDGNRLWCDSGCDPRPAFSSFHVSDVDASENTGGGVRYENATTKALIENSHIHGNSTELNRAGITIRDAQNATIRQNVFDGQGFDHNQAPKNIAIRADSGGRHPVKNILIENNDLNGERIKDCGGPVTCRGNN